MNYFNLYIYHVHQPIYLLSIYIHIYPSSIYMIYIYHQSIYLSTINLYIYLSSIYMIYVYLSSIYISIYHQSIYISIINLYDIYLSSIYISIYHQSIYLSIINLYIYLPSIYIYYISLFKDGWVKEDGDDYILKLQIQVEVKSTFRYCCQAYFYDNLMKP